MGQCIWLLYGQHPQSQVHETDQPVLHVDSIPRVLVERRQVHAALVLRVEVCGGRRGLARRQVVEVAGRHEQVVHRT